MLLGALLELSPPRRSWCSASQPGSASGPSGLSLLGTAAAAPPWGLPPSVCYHTLLLLKLRNSVCLGSARCSGLFFSLILGAHM